MALEKIDSIISIRIDTYILPLFKNFKVCGIKIDKNLPNVEIIDGIISKIKQILISHDICEIAINYKCQILKEDILNMVDICENIIQTEYNKYYSTIAEVTNYINNTFIEAEDKENSILYNICKDTIKSHIYSQSLNQTLLNNYIKKNIIQKIHDIYCTNIIEYNIDMIIKDNMSYIIKFNQNDLNKSSCCFLNSNYCNDNPEYKLYPFTQYETEIYTLVNYNINNMSQYINTLIIDCIYLVLQNDYNIENNIILLLSEYESEPKISNMIIQFSNESSMKIVFNVLKYYFKNINLKIYPYDVNKIRICCLHHNMEQFINILRSIDECIFNYINKYSFELESDLKTYYNDTRTISCFNYEQIIKFKYNNIIELHMKSYLDTSFIKEIENTKNDSHYIFTFNISNIYFSNNNNLLPLVKCNRCEQVI